MKTNTIVMNKNQMCCCCMCCMDEYGFIFIMIYTPECFGEKKKQAVVITI